jgi:hypothetical protein
MLQIRAAAQVLMATVSYLFLILTKTGMGGRVLVKLPTSSFVKISSAVLRLFHAYRRAKGAILTGIPRDYERA